MRFSLLQLLLMMTAASVLVALVVHVPLVRAISVALVLVFGLGVPMAKGIENGFLRWLRASLGAWAGWSLWFYIMNGFPELPTSRDVVQILLFSLPIGCFLGACISAAFNQH